MSISLYSVFTSFLWFNLFIVILCFWRRRLKIALAYQLSPLILLVAMSLVRLLFPFEPSFAIELESTRVLPFIQDQLRTPIITIGSVTITLATVIVLSFSFVSVILLMRLFSLVQRKQESLKVCKPTNDTRLLALFDQVQEELPSKRSCILKISDSCVSPCIFGVMHSVILLPKTFFSLSDQDIYYVLKHEWQHHLDWDVTIKLLTKVICCIMWWDPLVYLLKYHLDQTLEFKCDAKVTKKLNNEQRVCYAEALLHVLALTLEKRPSKNHNAREESIAISFVGAAFHKKVAANTDTIQRFDALLECGKQNKKVEIACGSLLLFLFCFSFCFVIQPFSLPTPQNISHVAKGDVSGPVSISPESSFLLDNKDGTYAFFLNGTYMQDITEEEKESDFFQSLPIISNIENKI